MQPSPSLKSDSAWRVFWEAATTPSLPALIGALAVVLGLAGLVMAYCGDALIRRTDYHLLMANAWDDHSRLTALAVQGAARHAGAWTVCFLGASEVREALEPDAFWEHRLQPVTPAAPTSVTLAANAMRRDAAFAILDRFGADFPGLVVLPTNLQSLSVGPGENSALPYLLGFRSPYLPGISRGFGLIANLRMGTLLLFHRASPDAAWLPSRPVREWDRYHFDAPAAKAIAAEAGPGTPDQAKVEANLRWIARTIGLVRRAGRARVVLLEIPRQEQAADSVVPPRRAAELAAYRARIRAFAAEMRVPWLDVVPESRLSVRDFTDRAHLGDPDARRRFSAKAADALAREIGRPTYSP